MKILSVSDYTDPVLHERFDASCHPKADLILACGDLPPEYLVFLRKAFKAPLYYVRGNHDIRHDSSPPDGCMNIHGKIVEFKGIRMMGLEGSRWYNGGPVQYTEARMRKMIRRLWLSLWWGKGVDIIIAHAPPGHINDAEDLCHRGFRIFRRLIDKYSPAWFIHGHIHQNFPDPSKRVTLVDKTKVVNTCGYYFFEFKHKKMV